MIRPIILAALMLQFVLASNAAAGPPTQPQFRPLPPPPPPPPPPAFVPVADMNKVYPRRLSDDVNLATAFEVLVLILAVDRIADPPTKTKKPAEAPK